jgi:four helix bundle protein
MTEFADMLADRFVGLVVGVIQTEKQMVKTYAGRHIFGQLFRAVSSAGANYEEARAGESTADFIHKMQIVLKELRESKYWLKVIVTARLVQKESEIVHLQKESSELTRIVAKAVVTAKSNRKANQVNDPTDVYDKAFENTSTPTLTDPTFES